MTIDTISINFFFFQAEDGIRDYKVTGVQTCALPISLATARGTPPPLSILMMFAPKNARSTNRNEPASAPARNGDQCQRCRAMRKKRSEERRVGKECRSRWSPYH